MKQNLKKVKRKLEIMEMEGVNDLLFDFMDATGVFPGQKLLQADWIRAMKAGYLLVIQSFSPPEPKQQKLFNEE